LESTAWLPGRISCGIFLNKSREILHYDQMARTIISVGYEIPGFSDDCHGYMSDQSLLDADVIVFEPVKFDESYGAGISVPGFRRFCSEDFKLQFLLRLTANAPRLFWF
jgi:hypothetical protein